MQDFYENIFILIYHEKRMHVCLQNDRTKPEYKVKTGKESFKKKKYMIKSQVYLFPVLQHYSSFVPSHI